ncbi:Rieske 2Fe-2S domain-containing protein [Lacisediminihabitans changchengi]|uniref:Rieske 2Fe-2S domain-containing protein n=1 Tax=Lacisediminihabitans changchengi TaxID=2787634 RepID=A0A934SM86_9MICO|nr:Rieske 2Fe-2S domain-containing protein [Lacisediminihabitans changchengi]MBK4346927.1 Rieske 2Fe-2S domain-containing protein [Lacisediminihabitans changchengi]MBK4347950.1 Rieske 2Fe-2S domain-containing protein [Lacisediminihabitans changchengi]
MQELTIVQTVADLESDTRLDPVVTQANRLYSTLFASRRLRDLLHGVPLGHPLHPLAVQVPLGAFTSSAVLDLFPKTARQSKLLVGLGIVSAIPSIAAGWVDWLSLHRQQQRVGIVHAAANATAVGLYVISYLQRGRGHQASGRLFGYAGLAVMSIGGYLGGHLAYRQASGANHAEDVPHLMPSGWQVLAPLEELPDGELSTMDVAGQPLLVLRRGHAVSVLSNTCSHLSGPLNQGELVDEESGSTCVSCPWHGSVFDVETGAVVHGPATSPQPRFITRVQDGVVQVQLPGADG